MTAISFRTCRTQGSSACRVLRCTLKWSHCGSTRDCTPHPVAVSASIISRPVRSIRSSSRLPQAIKNSTDAPAASATGLSGAMSVGAPGCTSFGAMSGLTVRLLNVVARQKQPLIVSTGNPPSANQSSRSVINAAIWPPAAVAAGRCPCADAGRCRMSLRTRTRLFRVGR